MSDDDDDDDVRRDEDLGHLWVKIGFYTDEDGDVRVHSEAEVLVREGMTVEDMNYIVEKRFMDWRDDADEVGDSIMEWMDEEPGKLAGGTSTVPYKP